MDRQQIAERNLHHEIGREVEDRRRPGVGGRADRVGKDDLTTVADHHIADDDDAADDDDSTIDVPIEPSCDGANIGDRVRTGVPINLSTVGPTAGTLAWDANEPDEVVFTATADGATFTIWGGDGFVDYAALAALGTVTGWGVDWSNESEDLSQSALWDGDALVFQSGESLWEDPPSDAPGDAWSVLLAAGDCPIEPTGNPECYQNRRVIPARFTKGSEEVWLYPGQEVQVDGLRGSATRAFLSTVLVLSRSKRPIKVFANPVAAAPWLVPRLGQGWSDETVIEACADVSARLGLPQQAPKP